MRFQTFFLFVVYAVIILAQNNQISLELASGYPQWLETDNYRTDQTSGITFIKSESGKKYFLLADDIGKIHMLIIKDKKIDLYPITFADSAKEFVNSLPKADFEEITFDSSTNSVYLSIEGNGNNFNEFVGIYKIHFTEDKIPYKEISYFEKLNFTPSELFYKYTDKNIGYEGFAVNENYFYLGLEGLVKNYQFADSTYIFIARKSDYLIVKQISTKSFGIHTICGLYSDSNNSLWGIDRNQRKIFHLILDENLDVKNFNLYDCSTQIPGYPELNYKPSLESITIDDENNIYLIDDPWKEVYVPEQETLNKLNTNTIENFKKFVPIIFSYKIIKN